MRRFLADCSAPYWCTNQPFQPHGPVADRIHSVFVPLFIVSFIVWLAVTIVILWAAFRFRRKSDDEEPVQVHGNNRLEIAWTIAPFAILIALFINTAINMPFINNVNASDQQASSGNKPMGICTQGERFLWKYFYYNDAVLTDNTQDSCTAHEQKDSTGKANYGPKKGEAVVQSSYKLVVPVKTAVKLTIVSTDVNHSFYVPSIAGQVNAIPGQVNDLWFQADDPGVYHGSCLELCGDGHASMLIEIDALSQSDYQKWYSDAKAKAQSGG